MSAADPIVVVDSDPSWAQEFERLSAPIREVVRGLGAVVEHVGSTAVPGLAAKPIIDLDVVVPVPDAVAPAIEQLISLGYRHEGDLGICGREALHWPANTARHHTYIVVDGSPPHRDHVDFREALLADAETAAEYAELKRSLAREHRDDRAAYLEGKSVFIARVLARARA
jgi:GrpB-like predicted nucleotidyltransferase (UPF0157 family)